MKFLFIGLLMCLLSVSAISQEIISSAGSHAEAAGVQLSWTLGEPVIETLTGGSNILTQGFHQTRLTVTPAFSITENNNISVFPNPVGEEINIRVTGFEMLPAAAGLFTPDGKLLKRLNLTGETTVFKVNGFPNGSYLLKITSENEPVRTFKLVKMY